MLTRQIVHFIAHLRWPYQTLLLSGTYGLSILYVQEPNFRLFAQYFVLWHLGLYGGATAFNSYWDKDEGPIGGLKNPPPMRPWMRWASFFLMMVPAPFLMYDIVSDNLPMVSFAVYVLSFLLFWAYSSPLLRWKGHPYLSVLVIFLSTGTNGFFMGYFSSSGMSFSLLSLLAALGVASILVSLYPISQLFQLEEDRNRGDRTLALQIGVKGVRTYYMYTYSFGSILVGASLSFNQLGLAIFFIVASLGGFLLTYSVLHKLQGTEKEYKQVMRIKYLSSFSFLLYILIAAWYVHIG
jgi:1,4-dihydroxy-2-naphthoate octaprenyltransferase